MTARWTCDELLRGQSSKPYALIIVNQPIRSDLLHNSWKAASKRICADGGANRLYEADKEKIYLPDLIKGDLDSIRPEVQAYYQDQGVLVVEDKDEYSTDLMKCIAEVPRDHAVVLLGGLSGRVDQTVHTMSILHKTDREMFGKHEITIDHDRMGQTCGILPVGVDSSRVKTKGLKWDFVSEWDTSLQGDLSTSNHLQPDQRIVTIETSRPVLWTVEIRPA
ncbi:thiamine pyrophosphokinase [Kwoniella sp. DSM 27419]